MVPGAHAGAPHASVPRPRAAAAAARGEAPGGEGAEQEGEAEEAEAPAFDPWEPLDPSMPSRLPDRPLQARAARRRTATRALLAEACAYAHSRAGLPFRAFSAAQCQLSVPPSLITCSQVRKPRAAPRAAAAAAARPSAWLESLCAAGGGASRLLALPEFAYALVLLHPAELAGEAGEGEEDARGGKRARARAAKAEGAAVARARTELRPVFEAADVQEEGMKRDGSGLQARPLSVLATSRDSASLPACAETHQTHHHEPAAQPTPSAARDGPAGEVPVSFYGFDDEQPAAPAGEAAAAAQDEAAAEDSAGGFDGGGGGTFFSFEDSAEDGPRARGWVDEDGDEGGGAGGYPRGGDGAEGEQSYEELCRWAEPRCPPNPAASSMRLPTCVDACPRAPADVR